MELLTMQEAGKVLRTSRQHVYNEYKRGKLPAVRSGKVLRIDRKDLEKYIQSNKEGSYAS